MSLADEKFYRAKIIARKDIGENLWTIRVLPEQRFDFAPGQYATIGVLTSSKLVERPYSIASSPDEPELEFFLELVSRGELTPLLYRLQVGDTVTLRKVARGRFTLDRQSGRTNHLLLCTVTGIAPFVSFARALYKDWKDGRFGGEHRLFLLEGASRSWEFGYQDEIARYASEVPWLKYVSTVSRPWEDPAWKGEIGRVDDIIRKYADSWGLAAETTTAYLCGHPSMIDNASGILVRRGWRKEDVRQEVYFIPKRKETAGVVAK